MRKFIVFAYLLIPLFALPQQEQTPIPAAEVAHNVYRLFVNNAVAVVAFTGDDGLLIVDTGYERTANDLKDKLSEVSAKPLRYIVNTHIHGDHTGGNQALGDGVDIIAHRNVKEYLSADKVQGDRIISAFPMFAQPNITFTDRMELEFNGQLIQLIHLPSGHTNGDIILYFPKSNVLVVGDLLFANNFPYVDVANGGNPFKYLDNVGWIIDNFPNDATVIGGHGPVFTVDEYNQWKLSLEQTFEVIRDHKRNGLTAEQMKQQRVLKEWESFGKFFITEDRWIDTLFPFL
ncbi:MAG: MBL fold metallo-hydrolase [Bacteroidales bacterium]|nr:MBL fold metallo-hydrolase [Bacteroidales bacterium]